MAGRQLTAKGDSCLLGNPIRRRRRGRRRGRSSGGGGRLQSLTSLVPEPHVFHAGCNELVRKVGINFDDKYLVLASPGVEEKKTTQHKFCFEGGKNIIDDKRSRVLSSCQ